MGSELAKSWMSMVGDFGRVFSGFDSVGFDSINDDLIDSNSVDFDSVDFGSVGFDSVTGCSAGCVDWESSVSDLAGVSLSGGNASVFWAIRDSVNGLRRSFLIRSRARSSSSSVLTSEDLKPRPARMVLSLEAAVSDSVEVASVREDSVRVGSAGVGFEKARLVVGTGGATTLLSLFSWLLSFVASNSLNSESRLL